MGGEGRKGERRSTVLKARRVEDGGEWEGGRAPLLRAHSSPHPHPCPAACVRAVQADGERESAVICSRGEAAQMVRARLPPVERGAVLENRPGASSPPLLLQVLRAEGERASAVLRAKGASEAKQALAQARRGGRRMAGRPRHPHRRERRGRLPLMRPHNAGGGAVPVRRARRRRALWRARHGLPHGARVPCGTDSHHGRGGRRRRRSAGGRGGGGRRRQRHPRPVVGSRRNAPRAESPRGARAGRRGC